MSLEIPSFDAAVELENRQQVLTALTDDQSEAMRAFRERRPPATATADERHLRPFGSRAHAAGHRCAGYVRPFHAAPRPRRCRRAESTVIAR